MSSPPRWAEAAAFNECESMCVSVPAGGEKKRRDSMDSSYSMLNGELDGARMFDQYPYKSTVSRHVVVFAIYLYLSSISSFFYLLHEFHNAFLQRRENSSSRSWCVVARAFFFFTNKHCLTSLVLFGLKLAHFNFVFWSLVFWRGAYILICCLDYGLSDVAFNEVYFHTPELYLVLVFVIMHNNIMGFIFTRYLRFEDLLFSGIMMSWCELFPYICNLFVGFYGKIFFSPLSWKNR